MREPSIPFQRFSKSPERHTHMDKLFLNIHNVSSTVTVVMQGTHEKAHFMPPRYITYVGGPPWVGTKPSVWAATVQFPVFFAS
jgi:hypothetical protein